MADRGQKVAAAWPPHARLAPTTPRAGRLEVEDALLPSARALPPPSLLPLARSAEVEPPTAIVPPSSRVRSPSPSTSLQLAESFALPSFTISVRL